MKLTTRNIISIVECVFYAPTTVLSLFLCIRHCCRGKRAQIAWIFRYLYCHVRVAEAALGLATITFPSATVYSTSILFSLIGVPTLLLTTFGLLNRVFINLSKNYPTRIKAWYFSLLQIPFQAAIVILAKGASNSTADLSDGAPYSPQIWTKVGIMLCVAGFFVMAILTFVMVRRQSHTTPTEHQLLHTVIRSLPFLFIRLMYTILSTFMDRNVFKSYEGNVHVISLMALLPEMIVVVIYMAEGFTLPRLEKDKRTEKKCRRKKGGWPERLEVLDDVSITRTDSEEGWKDVDDKSSCRSGV
jgi:hypothetical protein